MNFSERGMFFYEQGNSGSGSGSNDKDKKIDWNGKDKNPVVPEIIEKIPKEVRDAYLSGLNGKGK